MTWYLMEPAAGRAYHGAGAVRSTLCLPMVGKQPSGWPVTMREETIKNITDGTSKTLLAAESTNLYNRRRTFWAYTFGTFMMSQTTTFAPALSGDYCACVAPGTNNPPCTSASGAWFGSADRACKGGWGSNHQGGMNAVMCDGSGTFISFDMDLNAFAAMGSIAGGEDEATGL